MSKKSSGFLAGAVIGGVAAATAALLLAPTSGKKLRKDLIEQLDDLSDGKASELVDLAQEKGVELGELAKEKTAEYPWVGEQIFQLKDDSSELLDNFKNQTQTLSEGFQTNSDKLKSTVNPIIEDDIVLSADDIAYDVTEAIDDRQK